MRAFRGGASPFIKGFPTSCEAPALLMDFRLLTQRQWEGGAASRRHPGHVGLRIQTALLYLCFLMQTDTFKLPPGIFKCDSPWSVWRHWPVLMSQIFTVESAFPETRMLSLSSMPLVRDWCPVSVWMQFPVSTSQTRIDVSNEPLTTWIPSNWKRGRMKKNTGLADNAKLPPADSPLFLLAKQDYIPQ